MSWHGVELDRPDWSDVSHSLAFTLRSRRERHQFHVMLNAYWEALGFAIPARVDGHQWCRWIDTALPSPDDIGAIDDGPRVEQPRYMVQPRSIAILTLALHASPSHRSPSPQRPVRQSRP